MHRVAKDKFILNITFAWEHAVAVTNENDSGKLVSHRFPQFSFSPELVPNFFKYLMLDKKFKDYLELCSPGGAGRNRVLKIKEMLKYEIKIPKSTKEQTAIGNFFKQLDETIALHQRQTEKYQKLKIGFLENIFCTNLSPNNSKKTNAWEQRKLGEVLSLLKDGTHGTHLDVKNGAYLLSAKNIKNGKIYINSEDRQISFSDYQKIHSNFSLQKGDVLLTIVGTIGDVAILEEASNITFQRSVAYLRPEKVTSNFLASLIASNDFQNNLRDKQTVSAQAGIYLGDLSEIEIKFPTLPEQTAIGNFFKQLDETIALHQRQMEKYQQIKQLFLDKMFVK